MKRTTLVIEPASTAPDMSPVPESEGFLYDPEDKTPIAPPPSITTLQHAGAGAVFRHRTLLLAAAGVIIGVIAFISGAYLSGSRNRPVAIAPAPVDPPAVSAPVAVAAEPDPVPAAQEPAPAAEPALEPDIAPVPVPATEPDTILLAVTVSPPDAQVMIDRQVMPSNPFVARFPRSVDTHRIRVAAPGYQSKERLVSFSDNVTLDLSLSPVEAEPAAPAVRERPVAKRPAPPPRRISPPALAPAPVRDSPAAAAAAPPPAAELLPRPLEGDTSRRRRIEARDPYADDNP